MNYEETIQYLFNSAPLFQHIGAGAYKEGLYNTKTFDSHFLHPHRQYKTIHIGGTNGKGSCAHTLAAILQNSGYKVGLYTSPHLVDFRERIRINGEMVSKEFVVDFIAKEKSFFEEYHPSFFELTTAMALYYFALQKVDVAVIEVGLGGRLDCTNIINPDLSIITNISLDHTQFLGDTLDKIAYEKAGIIKKGIPVVIGEKQAETTPVFCQKAKSENAPIIFAEDNSEVISMKMLAVDKIEYMTKTFGVIYGCLAGDCQIKNTNTILTAVIKLIEKGYKISKWAVNQGFLYVCEQTGLMGRWQKIGEKPLRVCDTGHNLGGWTYLACRLKNTDCTTLRIVFGMVNDKDINGVLSLMPKDAVYYFAKPSVSRGIPETEVQSLAKVYGMSGTAYSSVADAYKKAMMDAGADDVIFIGGSSFIVADLLSINLNERNNVAIMHRAN